MSQLMLTSLDGAKSYTTTGSGVHVEKTRSYGIPERDSDAVHVAGRNGDVLIDHGCYRNEKIQFDLYAFQLDHLYALATFIDTVKQGYVLIADTDAPWQRVGRLSGNVPIDQIIHAKLLRFTLAFDCKPQKYSDYSEVLTGTNSIAVPPPALFSNSEPRMEITGSGSVTINVPQGAITVPGLQVPSGGVPSLVIDTGLQLAYKTASSGTRTAVDVPFFPVFGRPSAVSVAGSVTGMKIYPRWVRF